MKEFQPKRLRIVQKTMEKYTGPIGITNFVDGVSVEPVSYKEMRRIGAIMEVVDADDGKVVNPAEDALRNRDEPVDSYKVQSYGSGDALKVNPNLSARRLSLQELEAIADQEGLAGVREIARKWGKTGRSIQECIEAVLSSQADADEKGI